MLIGGGDVPQNAYDMLKKRSFGIVAADGGADFIVAQGDRPMAVIGDFDSITAELRHALPPETLFHIPEQNSTDLEKSLTQLDFSIIFALGFMGSRLDHQMAAQTALVKFPHRRVILVGQEDILFLCPAQLRLDLPAQTRISFYPMTEMTAQSEGLRWELTGLNLSPLDQIATSNMAEGAISVTPSGPYLLTVLPREFLPLVEACLISLQDKWPDPRGIKA